MLVLFRINMKLSYPCRRGEDDLIINNIVSRKFFDRKWHKLEIQFGREKIRVFLDCRKVGDFPVNFPLKNLLSESGMVISGSFNQSTRSPVVNGYLSLFER